MDCSHQNQRDDKKRHEQVANAGPVRGCHFLVCGFVKHIGESNYSRPKMRRNQGRFRGKPPLDGAGDWLETKFRLCTGLIWGS